jgi:hypothetical protein
MSGHIEHWIECDVCHVATVYHSSLIAARREAKAAGWIQRRHGSGMIDVCPKCQEREQEPQP